MGAAQVGLREDDEDRAVVVAAAKSILRMSRVTSRAPSRPARSSSAPSKRERAIDSARLRSPASADGLVRGRARRVAREQAGLRIEHAVGVERLEHALEPRLEGVHAHQRHHARDQAGRIAVDMIDIGQASAKSGGASPITATGMSRKRVSCASTVRKASTMRGEKPSPTTMPSISRELRCLAAVSTLERAQHVDALADGDAERRIKRAAAGDQHGGVVERVADRQRRQLAAMRGEHFDAAQHRRVQRAHAHAPIAGARSAARPARRRRPAARSGWRRPARRATRAMVGTMGPLAVAICRQSMRAEDSLVGGPGSAIMTAAGLTATKAVGASAQFGLDDGEGAGGAQRFDEVGRRVFGDHDDRTLKRHGAHATRLRRRATLAAGLLTPRQRHRTIKRHRPWRGARKAPAMSGLAPRACNSAAIAGGSAALPARRSPSSASGRATMVAAGSTARHRRLQRAGCRKR